MGGILLFPVGILYQCGFFFFSFPLFNVLLICFGLCLGSCLHLT